MANRMRNTPKPVISQTNLSGLMARLVGYDPFVMPALDAGIQGRKR